MNKILVANRGEIALRIMKTARRMGILTVAVYSEVDREAPHVLYADEAFLLGPPPSSQSYLKGDKIIEIAKAHQVDGIHPGYGFLSENADFAQAVMDAGIIFIGPKPPAIRMMGSKLEAKEAAKAYGIPLLPGSDGAITDVEEAISIANKIGYPVLIKASAGGGGKGMRIVENSASFVDAMAMATNEALSSFGDGSVFVEKYLRLPRHIEIQVLADNHGNIVHLFERECSIQRRHQKIIEEAPSAVLPAQTRHQMGLAAINAARACNYSGAGTVEFLLDKSGEFYFLEMNTRLQVEHPVTEYITGIDLVEQQIRVARNEKLAFTQDDLKINGHSIELRVYAEDPMSGFTPSIGTLSTYIEPTGQGIRVDSGVVQGMQVPVYYDPMLSKLIVHADNRMEAIQLMKKACAEYRIDGCDTTILFGRFVMDHPAFKSGDYDTFFVNKYFQHDEVQLKEEDQAQAAAYAALYLHLRNKKQLKIVSSNHPS